MGEKKDAGSQGGRSTGAGDTAARKDPDPVLKPLQAGPESGKTGSQAVPGKASSGKGTLFGMWGKGGGGSKSLEKGGGESKEGGGEETGKGGKEGGVVEGDGKNPAERKRASRANGLQGKRASRPLLIARVSGVNQRPPVCPCRKNGCIVQQTALLQWCSVPDL